MKAKYLQNEEMMNCICDQNILYLNPIDESSMDGEWDEQKWWETMTRVINIRGDLHIPQEQMFYVSKDTFWGCGLDTHLHYMYKKSSYPGKNVYAEVLRCQIYCVYICYQKTSV